MLANQPDGNTLVLYDVENDAARVEPRDVQTLNLNNGTSTPSIQTGILFKQNTAVRSRSSSRFPIRMARRS